MACLALAWALATLATPGWTARALYDPLAVLTADPPSGDIVLVGIDEPSLAAFGEAWPWPRGRHADLVDALAAAGARLIVFDIVFAGAGRDPDGDRRFAAAMARHGTVVLANELDRTDGGAWVMVGAAGLAPVLARAAAGLGFAELPVDPDGVVRRHAGIDSLSAAAAAHASPAAPPPAPWLRWSDASRGIGGWPYASYVQALRAATDLPPDMFRGRIAIVGLEVDTGSGAGSGRDRFDTPFTVAGLGSLAGYAIHAHALEDRLREGGGIAPRPEAGLALAALALLPLAAPRRRWLSTPFAALLGGAGVLVLAILLLDRASVWVPPLPALVALTTGVAALGLLALVEARAARRALRDAFSRYVADEVIGAMAEQGVEPVRGGEEREVTALFTDLAGFSAMTDALPADRLGAVLDDYFEVMTGIVFAHRGTLERFTGDGLVVLFNAPVAQPDHAARALACAAALDEAGVALSERWRVEGVPLGETRVGVNTGRVTVGNFGARRRFHYTAMGTPMNLAARLEALNKALGTRVCVGEATVRAASGSPAPELREVGRIAVRGLPKPERVHTLVPSEGWAPAGRWTEALRLRDAGDAAAARDAFRRLAAEFPDDLLVRREAVRDHDGAVDGGPMHGFGV